MKYTLARSIAISLLALSSYTATVHAAPPAEQKIGAKVGKPLKEAQTLAQAQDYQGAMAKAREAEAVADKTPFEKYKVEEFISFIALSMKDYPTARQNIEAMLAEGQVPADQVQVKSKQLVQLATVQQDYPAVAKFGATYLQQFPQDVDVLRMVSESYYIQKDCDNTLVYTKRLIDAENQAGTPPVGNELKIQLSCQTRLNKLQDAAATIEQMLAVDPSKENWQNAVILARGQTKPSNRRLLELYRLNLATDTMKAEDYADLADTAMRMGFPGEAKAALEKGAAANQLDSRATALLSQAKTAAAQDREALPRLEREAQAAKTGKPDIVLGETLASYGEYDKAIAAFTRGLQKGSDVTDEAHLQLGLAYLQSNRKDDAIAEFKKISSTSEFAQLGRLWTIYANKR